MKVCSRRILSKSILKSRSIGISSTLQCLVSLAFTSLSRSPHGCAFSWNAPTSAQRHEFQSWILQIVFCRIILWNFNLWLKCWTVPMTTDLNEFHLIAITCMMWYCFVWSILVPSLQVLMCMICEPIVIWFVFALSYRRWPVCCYQFAKNQSILASARSILISLKLTNISTNNFLSSE